MSPGIREIFFVWMGCVSCIATAQQRILTSPNTDILLSGSGESKAKVLERSYSSAPANNTCDTSAKYGYPVELFPPNLPFIGYAGDVFGMWFDAPFSGRIDSLFFEIGDFGTEFDSRADVRIFRSNIYSGHGPGDSVFPPPCTPWGYYRTSPESLQNISPYRDEATDTAWISSVSGSTPSYDPLGEELWGNGGFDITLQRNRKNVVALDFLGYKPHLQRGEPFFVCLRLSRGTVPGANFNKNVVILASTSGPDPPSRNWKFYARGHSPGCGDTSRPGWYARDGSEQSGRATVWNWEYRMTVDSGVVPLEMSIDQILEQIRFQSIGSDSIRICSKICPAISTDSISFFLSYSVDGSPEKTLDWTRIDDSLVCLIFPRPTAGSLVCYKLHVTDIFGNIQSSSPFCSPIAGIVQHGYGVDTAASFQWIELDSITAPISGWIYPGPCTEGCGTDDGTTGPFDLGFPFTFFGTNVRYAWIGVNGGIALTPSPLPETRLDCSFGFAPWSIPNVPGSTCVMPRNFIAPFWADMALPGSDGGAGSIRKKTLDRRFIVEWDSVGFFNPNGATVSFELVVDASDLSITFLYKDIERNGILGRSLVGVESDSANWLFLYQHGAPPQLTPRNGRAFKIAPGIDLNVSTGWNLVSLPLVVSDPSRSHLFPEAASALFSYETGRGYKTTDSLRRGYGYWLKLAGAQPIHFVGSPTVRETAMIAAGWNIIGSISQPVSAQSISSLPGGLTVSPFFGYSPSSASYIITDTIKPGLGYWVKSSAVGKLILSSIDPPISTTRIQIVSIPDHPPAPPTKAGAIPILIPTDFALEQNYPNPFNPTTKIRYEIPELSRVKLTIFDVLGREVATLVNETKEVGQYTLSWDASALPAGVYMYKLTAGANTKTRKMLLIR